MTCGDESLVLQLVSFRQHQLMHQETQLRLPNPASLLVGFLRCAGSKVPPCPNLVHIQLLPTVDDEE